ncbi:MAG TPA: VIT and VWA domain-containing protein [Anaeromyxobacter sp.]|nr:VIT and VWA domain-containing protein [Anaeromyxobacter sp.]
MARLPIALALFASLATLPRPAAAQRSALHVVPQARLLPHVAGNVEVTAVDAVVVVDDPVATTTLDVSLRNPTGARLEAQVLVPVPSRAAIRDFRFQGASTGARAELLPAADARRLYDDIVRRERDPALLEFAGQDLVRSSVFPVEPGGTQKVRLVYEHVLPEAGGRVDYVLPRTESLEYRVPWRIRVHLRARAPISTVYSPSHPFRTTRLAAGELALELEAAAATAPGPVRLSYLRGGDGLAATSFVYPEAGGEAGYFLVVAGLPPPPAETAPIPRELTLVLDRSGSMRGPKWDQAVAAAGEVLRSLRPGERFQVVTYNHVVDGFTPSPVPVAPDAVARALAWIRAQAPAGGTNVHEALATALAPDAAPGTLPLVLFLTDGLPTVGETREPAIVSLATRGNPARRRIFTYGVGEEPSTALLERLASESRAAATFILPGEDVRARVAESFRRLGTPVLADPELRWSGNVDEVFPARLPDLFEGDPLVLVGRFRGAGPIELVLEGREAGRARAFRLRVHAGGTVRHGFVPRLWAQRKISELLDRIRYAGADPGAGAERTVAALSADVVRLSRQFGILTEYTAFFLAGGPDEARPPRPPLAPGQASPPGPTLASEIVHATEALRNKALRVRSGKGSVAQDANRASRKAAGWVDPRNALLSDGLEKVELGGVNQIGDLAFHRRGGRWVDARLLDAPAADTPRTVVAAGSAYALLVDRLVREGRQGVLALRGERVVLVDGEAVLLVNP